MLERTTTENATFPDKTALSKTTVKLNRIGSTNGTFQKKQIFAVNFFIFLKI